MAVTFNALNPMTWWTLPLGGSASVFAPSKPAPKQHIAIAAAASDRGITVSVSADRVTIAGTTKGPDKLKDIFGFPAADLARSVSFTLDIDDAPTKDVFGHTDYSKKNGRIFMVHTSKGASATQVADALAAKVNRAGEYRATVTTHDDGGASIDLARR